ncbi:hypothetical protein ACOME3_004055 [Neoechinorhynchus agilis]
MSLLIRCLNHKVLHRFVAQCTNVAVNENEYLKSQFALTDNHFSKLSQRCEPRQLVEMSEHLKQSGLSLNQIRQILIKPPLTWLELIHPSRGAEEMEQWKNIDEISKSNALSFSFDHLRQRLLYAQRSGLLPMPSRKVNALRDDENDISVVRIRKFSKYPLKKMLNQNDFDFLDQCFGNIKGLNQQRVYDVFCSSLEYEDPETNLDKYQHSGFKTKRLKEERDNIDKDI